jgi:hypothetical protein
MRGREPRVRCAPGRPREMSRPARPGQRQRGPAPRGRARTVRLPGCDTTLRTHAPPPRAQRATHTPADRPASALPLGPPVADPPDPGAAARASSAPGSWPADPGSSVALRGGGGLAKRVDVAAIRLREQGGLHQVSLGRTALRDRSRLGAGSLVRRRGAQLFDSSDHHRVARSREGVLEFPRRALTRPKPRPSAGRS